MKAGGVQFADVARARPRQPRRDPALPVSRARSRAASSSRSARRSRRSTSPRSPGTAGGSSRSLLFSDMGGIDIEEVAEKHPEHVSQTHFSTLLPFTPRHREGGDRARSASPATTSCGSRRSSSRWCRSSSSYDLTLAEINPLGEARGRPLPRARRPRRPRGRRARQAREAPRGARHRRARRRARRAPPTDVRDRAARRSTRPTTAASPATWSSSTATSAS